MERIHISKRILLIVGVLTALACCLASGMFSFSDVIPLEITTRLSGLHQGWFEAMGVF